MKLEAPENYTILHVEDDPLDRAALSRLAHDTLAPHHVEQADSCNEARGKLEAGRFDVALLDYNLGDGQGIDLLPACTKRDIPVILVTGAGSEVVAVQALRLGVRDYVIKDVQSNYLLLIPSLIDGVVRRHRAERERDRLYKALQDAQALIQRLHGLLPICSHCKSIRNDEGYWQGLEDYLVTNTGIELTHGLCPTCVEHYMHEMDKSAGG